MRGDLGLTYEKRNFGNSDNDTFTMTVATANVRTLHPREEREQIEVRRGLDDCEKSSFLKLQCATLT